MISLFFFLACNPGLKIKLGVVDVKDQNVCFVQMENENFIEVRGPLCQKIKEGDILQIKRYK